MNKSAWIALVGSILLASCSPATAVRQFEKGEELVFNDFSEQNTFEQGGWAGARLQITDGVYRITVTQGDSTFWWGQWGEVYDNVVIDVDVNQLSERNDNMYGVMCRVRGAVGEPITPDPILEAIMTAGEAENSASEGTSQQEIAPADATDEATVEADDEATVEAQDEADNEATEEATAEVTEAAVEATQEVATTEVTEAPAGTAVNNGDSYLFLIRGDGAYAIMRARGQDVQPLAGWGTTDAIHQGPGQNHIRAVCVGDYLALYVNDTFVADAIDDAYNQGQVGLAAASVDRLGVVVEFDNLSVSQAIPG